MREGVVFSMRNSIILLLLAALITIIPLVFLPGAEYGGADGEAEVVITEISPEYEPWFASFWEPPSGEIESLLFVLQAAIGSGIVFYVIGYYVGKKKGAEQASQKEMEHR